MKKTLLTLMAVASLTIAAFSHGSQGYAPDSYYRIATATTAINLSTNQKVQLPIGEIIHVLWFGKVHGKQVAYFQTQGGYTYYLSWMKLFDEDYLGEGAFLQNRPF